MNKAGLYVTSGILIFILGCTLMFATNIPFDVLKWMSIIVFSLEAIANLYLISKYRRDRAGKFYALINALLFIGFTLLLFFSVKDLASLRMVFTYFVLAYGLMEIIMLFITLSMKEVDHKYNRVIRYFATGTFNILVAVIILTTADQSLASSFFLIGAVMALGGLRYIVGYRFFSGKPKFRKEELPSADDSD